MASQIAQCWDWTAKDGIDHISVKHGGDDGVLIMEWYITGSTKTFYCKDEHWYYNDDWRDVECY